MKIHVIDESYVWVMDGECCEKCGCLLDYFETVLCTDCLHDAWYAEDREHYDSRFGDWDISIEEVGQP